MQHTYRPYFEPMVKGVVLLASLVISFAAPVAWYWKIAIFAVVLSLGLKVARPHVMQKFRRWYPPGRGPS
jgi:predicted Na+-dependent transporter